MRQLEKEKYEHHIDAMEVLLKREVAKNLKEKELQAEARKL